MRKVINISTRIALAPLALLLCAYTQSGVSKAYKKDGGGVAYLRITGEVLRSKPKIGVTMIDENGIEIDQSKNHIGLQPNRRQKKKDADQFVDFQIRGAPGRYIIRGTYQIDGEVGRNNTLHCDTFAFIIERDEINYVGDFEISHAGNEPVYLGYSDLAYLGRSEIIDETAILEAVGEASLPVVNTPVSAAEFKPPKPNFRTGVCNRMRETRASDQ